MASPVFDHYRRGRVSAVLTIAILLMGGGATASAVQPPSAAFDLWIGDWTITQRILQEDGSWATFPAETHVDDEGFALVEHWQGTVRFFWEGMTEPEPMNGLSVRSYDPEGGVWRIWWMDSRNPTFGLSEGTFEDGIGRFYREAEGADGSPYTARITFTYEGRSSVHWELAISRDGRRTWRPIWTMEMKRQE